MDDNSVEQRPFQTQRQTFCQNHQLTWVYEACGQRSFYVFIFPSDHYLSDWIV